MTERYDAVIVGAGHNGLVCAGYLARAGMRVLVCEAAAEPGGLAAGRTFGAGYRVPALAHVQPGLAAAIRRDLGLERFGYTTTSGLKTIALGGDGGPLTMAGDSLAGNGLGRSDAVAYREFRGRYLDFATALQPLFENKPPRLRNFAAGDRSLLARLGWKLRVGLGRDAMYEFLRIAAINIYDVLNEQFEDERLKAAIAVDAVLGNAMGPRTPGTVLTWLQRLATEHGSRAGLADPALVPALVAAAEDGGATIRCETPVTEILIDDDATSGVILGNGEAIDASRVVAAIDPRTALSRLVGAPRLDTRFADRVTEIRGSGVVGKLHLGLSGLPETEDIGADLLANRLVVAPSMRHIERAFNASKYGEVSEHPVFEITVPSLADPTLAPSGHHVMSINVAYLPYRLKAGWNTARDAVVRHLCAELEHVLPGLDALITDVEFLSPADIEREYGAVEGHWHHGEMSIHQSFMLRPLYGAAQYDTPVGGLYLCSAGCHPGGGVSGLPGRNAAKRILGAGGSA